MGTALAAPAVTVYPSGPSVPENLLRIELRFTEPQQEPIAIDHVHLLDAEGVEIPSAFLDLSLPSADGRRLTLLLHPARVKTGVGANLAFGRALHAGSDVTLQVDGPTPAQGTRKTWHVMPFDADPPEPGRWTFVIPAKGSRAPLALHFDKALNASADRMIAVRAPDGGPVPGRGVLTTGESIWLFTPAHPWQVGRYAIVTHPDLETPAGNRLCAPFESAEHRQDSCGSGTEQRFDIGR